MAFRGCPCSDAAGRQVCYADIAAAVRRGGAAGGSADGSAGGSRASGLEGPGTTPAGADASESGSQQRRIGGAWAAAAPEVQLVCEEPGFEGAQVSQYARCRHASNANAWFQVRRREAAGLCSLALAVSPVPPMRCSKLP